MNYKMRGKLSSLYVSIFIVYIQQTVLLLGRKKKYEIYNFTGCGALENGYPSL